MQTRGAVETDERRLLLPPTDMPLFVPAPARDIRLPARHAWSAVTLSAAQVKARAGFAAALQAEEAHGTPFLFVPVFLGVGAAAYFRAPVEPVWPLLLLPVVLLLALRLWALAHGGKAWVATSCLLVAIGACAGKLETGLAGTPMLGGDLSSTLSMRVRTAEPDGKSLRVVADVLATAQPVLKFPPSRVRVTLRNAPAGLAAGDAIVARLRLSPPSGPVRPDGYDFAFNAYFRGIGATGYAIGAIQRLPPGDIALADRVRFALENTRALMAARIQKVIPGTDGAVAAALIAGTAGGIDDDTSEAMRLTGLAHILSISGLHMALAAGVFMFAVRFAFSLFPARASRLPVKKFGAVAALAAILLYLALSGGGVATLRSFIMLAVMLAALLMDRQALTLRNLAIAAIVIILMSPHEVAGPSFQMSFAATAALIAAYSWSSARADRTVRAGAGGWRRFGAMLFGVLAAPIVAGLSTALYSAWHFHRLSPLSLPANLAALPVVSCVIMPSAVVSALAMPFGLEYWPLRMMGLGVHWMLAIAGWFASRSPSGLSGTIPEPAYLMASASLAILCLSQTWLRLVSLAGFALAAVWLANAPQPDILVSEDARLIAVLDGQGALAVNRNRPNRFTLETWLRASSVSKADAPEIGSDSVATGKPNPSSLSALEAAALAAPGIFHCSRVMCVIESRKGFSLVSADMPRPQLEPAAGNQKARPTGQPDAAAPGPLAAVPPNTAASQSAPRPSDVRQAEKRAVAEFKDTIASACRSADIVIANGPLPFRQCPEGRTVLLSARDLARKGAAAISMTSGLQTTVTVLIPDSQSASSPTPVGQASSGAGGGLAPSGAESGYQAASDGASCPTCSTSPWRVAIRFASGEPARPWNRERIFSRAARNLPEFIPVPRAKAALPAGVINVRPSQTDPAGTGGKVEFSGSHAP